MKLNGNVEEMTKKERLALATVLGALSALGPLCTDLYLPALPQVANSLATSTSATQLSLTSSLIGLSLGQLFIGPVSDIYGRTKPLAISMLLMIIVTFFCAFATDVLELIGLRFIQGLVGAGGIVLSRSIASDLYSGTELTKFFSLLMAINGVAPIASPVLGSQILLFSDWHGIFIVLGFISVGLFMGAIILPETLPREKRNTGGIRQTFVSFGTLFKNKAFMSYTLVQGFIFAGLFAYISASPFVLQDMYGLSAGAFSLCFAVNGIAIVIMAQIGARIAIAYGNYIVLRAGVLLSLVAALMVLVVAFIKPEHVGFILGAMLLSVASVGINSAPSFALAISAQQGAVGTASGLIGVTGFLFGAFASPLVGLGGNMTAVPMGLVMLVVALCNVGLVWINRPIESL